MKFSQKLVCTMLLVIAAFFAVGGAALVNGSFMDRLNAAAEQEQSMHAILCGVVEDYYLDRGAAPPPPGAQATLPAALPPRGCSAPPMNPPRTKPMPYTACRTAKAFCGTAPA